MSSGSFTEIAQCAGKQSFPTPQMARKIVQKSRQNKRHMGSGYNLGTMAHYHCRHCGLYHIGSKPKR